MSDEMSVVKQKVLGESLATGLVEKRVVSRLLGGALPSFFLEGRKLMMLSCSRGHGVLLRPGPPLTHSQPGSSSLKAHPGGKLFLPQQRGKWEEGRGQKDASDREGAG